MNKNEQAADRARNQVQAAAEQFIKETNGRRPRIKDIRAMCPGMSDSTISKYLRSSLEKSALSLLPSEEVTFSAKLQDAIREEIEDRTISECKRLSDELTALRDNHESVLSESLRFQEELAALKESYEHVTRSVLLDQGRLHQLEKDLKQSQEYLEQAMTAAESDRVKAFEAALRQKEAEEKIAALPELRDKISSERLLADTLGKFLARDDDLSKHMQDIASSLSDLQKTILPKTRDSSTSRAAVRS